MSNKLPQGWKKLSIDDVLIDKISGEWGKECENENEGVYVLRTTNFTNEGKLKLDEVVKRNIEEKKVDKKKLQYGDIILEKSGGSENQPVGRVVYFNIESEDIYLCNNFTQILRANPEIINSKYLLYVLFDIHRKGITEYFQNKTTGIRNLQTKSYLEQKINVPPLEEQERIVSILERAEDAICKREESNRLLEELVKSRFIEMFGNPATNPHMWSVSNYEDICRCITDGEHSTPKRCEEGIYLLSARNIHNHCLKLDNVDFIGEDEYERISKRIIPQENDILISCSGSVGRVCKVPKDIKFQMVRSVAILKLKENINPTFMEWLIDSNYTQQQILRSINQSSQANLFQGKIKKLKAIIPPIELQNEFEAFVNQVYEMKLKIEESLEELKNNFNSLMQRAFNGEL
ncbi:restriction endonuclease subunit S [Romboutsia sp. 1001216sp1]|uniref:restriction endonuclease subunit S n=1 Tax=unclassified Romboutsia TaxID=2626894 RepID=UPI0018AA93DB|nr:MULTISPECIES: restriction endonuclease subunit S [unclassified Romboutsia]MDB8794613.1 restriction endonuclease subunit S [Romboutsia sp. 1001216sp1]MDB8796567.1 restriction endonuclease subunit S [Romboutsia sp. 1001216sp1]MDB8798045.1 restriction endonuclease subunit S [Romboutsia sp. 1001216sp1]